MKKRIFYLATFLYASYLIGMNKVSAAADTLFGLNKIAPSLRNGDSDLVMTADNILGYIIGLVYFIAIIFAIYGGIMIMVSGGDEERVKKGKKIVLYMLLGIVVIFLASQIINWVIDVLSDEDIVGPTS